MEVKRNLQKLVSGAALSALLLGAPALAAAQEKKPDEAQLDLKTSTEMMLGGSGGFLDLRAGPYVWGKNAIFLRTIDKFSYSEKREIFGYVDASRNLIGGLDMVAEFQEGSIDGFVPRFGVQYFREVKNKSSGIVLFNITTLSPANKGSLENYFEAEVSHRINSDIEIVSHLQYLVQLGKTNESISQNFDQQKLRLGLRKGRLEIGAGVNRDSSPDGTGYNFGIYLIKKM